MRAKYPHPRWWCEQARVPRASVYVCASVPDPPPITNDPFPRVPVHVRFPWALVRSFHVSASHPPNAGDVLRIRLRNNLGANLRDAPDLPNTLRCLILFHASFLSSCRPIKACPWLDCSIRGNIQVCKSAPLFLTVSNKLEHYKLDALDNDQ